MTRLDGRSKEGETIEAMGCDHGITFNYAEYSAGTVDDDRQRITTAEFRKRWPRGYFTEEKPCPQCGFANGIFYASYEHYILGDW